MKEKEPFVLDPKEVRQIANRMGIPHDQVLPPVSVDDKIAKGYPKLMGYKKPPGYVILLPSSSVAKIMRDTYTLGVEGRDDVRHELKHFVQRKKNPRTRWSQSQAWKQLVWREMDAELRSGVRATPKSESIALIVRGVSGERKVPEEEVWGEAQKVAREMDISDRTLARAESLLRKRTPGFKPHEPMYQSISEAIRKAPKKTARRDGGLVEVTEHYRNIPSGGLTHIEQYTRRAPRL